MQYDTAAAVYNRPAALFVAGFTGAPPRNLVPCRVSAGEAAVGALRLALPTRLKAFDGEHTLGLRPENLVLSQADGDLPLPATLILLEPLGAETLITVRLGDVEMVARVSAAFRQAPGTGLTMYFNPAHLHLFDRQRGHALGHVDAA
jgi:multiple sugar transport system ATP-binding protein